MIKRLLSNLVLKMKKRRYYKCLPFLFTSSFQCDSVLTCKNSVVLMVFLAHVLTVSNGGQSVENPDVQYSGQFSFDTNEYS